jgi:alpha-L-rhamnosidase
MKMKMNLKRQKLFLQRADESRSTLSARVCHPVGEVIPKKSRAAFQGWLLEPAPKPKAWKARLHTKNSSSFILDFGEHVVGTFQFSLIAKGAMDAPLHLKLVFGEVPSEVCEPFDPYERGLSRGWLQDEMMNVFPPKKIRIERRMAFRYVKFEMTRPSPGYTVQISDVSCTAVSSANRKRLIPYRGPKEYKEIDAIGVRTLANCMHDAFEDGPKRDRRLWLGDLRLQALANEVTFRNYDLVRRSLYLLAAFAPVDDLIRSDVYVFPMIGQGGCCILDYALLFVPTLLEYTKASGDKATARELWTLAKFQVNFVLKKFVDQRGLFVDPKKYWLFIDWRHGLQKETPIQGILVFALGQLIKLAEYLGLAPEIPDALATQQKLIGAAREYLRDSKTGFYVSGQDRQISWHSQAWLIIAGVIPPDEGARLLKLLRRKRDAVRPAGPYGYHYVVEAMFICGLKKEAFELISTYWGGMANAGASTFWEIYDPENDHLSPYSNHHVNSYCHAWSCTPSYFIRRHFDSRPASKL